MVKFYSLFQENEYDAGGTISYHAGNFRTFQKTFLFAKLTIRMAKKMYVIESWKFVAEKKFDLCMTNSFQKCS